MTIFLRLENLNKNMQTLIWMGMTAVTMKILLFTLMMMMTCFVIFQHLEDKLVRCVSKWCSIVVSFPKHKHLTSRCTCTGKVQSTYEGLPFQHAVQKKPLNFLLFQDGECFFLFHLTVLVLFQQNPRTFKTDQHLISPQKITHESHMKFTRIKEIIANLRSS